MATFQGTLIVPVLASAPAAGAEGGLYYNSTDDQLYKSNGSAWSAVGGSGGGMTISDTAPGSPTAGQLWLKSDTLASYVYYDSQWLEIGGGGLVGPAGPAATQVMPWNTPGTLAVRAGTSRFILPYACTILSVRATAGTAPTGASVIVDVNKNGTTIFTNQANRPTIAVSTNASSKVTNMDVTAVADGDYLTVDIDQIGSTVAGADLVVVVEFQEA